jgi:hypothetical protein
MALCYENAALASFHTSAARFTCTQSHTHLSSSHSQSTPTPNIPKHRFHQLRANVIAVNGFHHKLCGLCKLGLLGNRCLLLVALDGQVR